MGKLLARITCLGLRLNNCTVTTLVLKERLQAHDARAFPKINRLSLRHMRSTLHSKSFCPTETTFSGYTILKIR